MEGVEIERLSYFRFEHLNTMVMFSGEKYTVSLLADGQVRLVIDEGFPGEKDLVLDDTSIFDGLTAILKEYRTDQYKKSYRRRFMVRDGDSWSLEYRFDSGHSVSSEGYMAWPRNYNEMRGALSSFFLKWREA